MSINVFAWALEYQDLPPDKRTGKPSSSCAFVLVGLANHASEYGTDSFPSIETLQRYTKLSERNVQYALAALLKHGTIHETPNPLVRDGYLSDPRARPKSYDIVAFQRHIAESAPRGAKSPGPGQRGRKVDHPGVQSQAAQGCKVADEFAPEPSLEPSVLEPSDGTWGGSPSPVGAPRERETPPLPEPRTEQPPPEPSVRPAFDPKNPRCSEHRHIPPNDPGPPCRACRAVRDRQTDEAATEAAAVARRTRECAMCDADGMRLDTRRGRLPLSPARRCDHSTPLADVLAEIDQREAELERGRARAGGHQQYSSPEARRWAREAIPRSRPAENGPKGQNRKTARMREESPA